MSLRPSWPMVWTGTCPIPMSGRTRGMPLGRLLGVSLLRRWRGERWAREELFAGWRLFFERLAAQRPVVLLIEDAQYADAGLLDFLDHLIDWTRDLPIFVLMFALPRARPGPGGVGYRTEPLHADPGPAGCGVDGHAGGCPGTRACRRRLAPPSRVRPRASRCSRWRRFAPLIDRDVVEPIEGVYRLVGDIGELDGPRQPARPAGRPARRSRFRGAAAGRRRRGAGHHLPRRGADRGVRAGRTRGAGGPGRAGAPGGAYRVRRPAVAGEGQLRLRPEHAAPGRLRHLVPAGPQGPPPEGRRAPARRLPRRRRGSRRGDRPATIWTRAVSRRPGRRPDPRPGHLGANPGGRTGRPHQRGRRWLPPAMPPPPNSPESGQGRRGAAGGRRSIVGTRRSRCTHQRRLGHRCRAGRRGPGAVPAVRRNPLRRPGPGDRRGGTARVGPARPGPRATHRCGRGTTRRPRHRHRPRPGRTGGRWRYMPAHRRRTR